MATEDVLYALKDSKYKIAGSEHGLGTIDLDKMVEIGWWISERLGKESVSRAGRALRSKRLREAELREGAKAKL